MTHGRMSMMRHGNHTWIVNSVLAPTMRAGEEHDRCCRDSSSIGLGEGSCGQRRKSPVQRDQVKVLHRDDMEDAGSSASDRGAR